MRGVPLLLVRLDGVGVPYNASTWWFGDGALVVLCIVVQGLAAIVSRKFHVAV